MTNEQTNHAAEPMPAPPSQPVFNLAGIVIAAITLNLAIHVLRVYILSREQDIWTLIQFAFFPVRYAEPDLGGLAGLWSPVTYSLLHGSWEHLIVNMVWLAVFGSPLACRLGTLRFLLFWCLTAVGAAALHYVFYPGEAVPVIGASGAVSGMMAAAARFGFRVDRHRRPSAFSGPVWPVAAMVQSRQVLVFLGIWFAINLATGLLSGGESASIAWQAHIGGFITGLVVLPWLDPRRYHAV